MFLSTGELSKRLNISIRTIRYYDQIGLVSPSKIGEGGRRFYSRQDSLRLEKIIVLKSLGLPLEEIKNILKEQSTETILLAHKSFLEEKLDGINRSIAHTNTLLNIIKLEERIPWDNVLYLHNTSTESKNWRAFFSNREEKVLTNNLPKMNDNTYNVTKWINLIKRIEHCIEEDIAPSSPQAHLIMEDLDILSEETFEGDDGLKEKFWEIRRSSESAAAFNLYPIDSKIIDFIEKAYASIY